MGTLLDKHKEWLKKGTMSVNGLCAEFENMPKKYRSKFSLLKPTKKKDISNLNKEIKLLDLSSEAYNVKT